MFEVFYFYLLLLEVHLIHKDFILKRPIQYPGSVMRRLSAVILAWMMVLGFLAWVDITFEVIPYASGDLLYVNTTGSNGAYISIQDAIEDAGDGDTIFVYSGTYIETAETGPSSKALKIEKSITLIGESKESTIIDASGKHYGISILFVDYVNISGFTIKESQRNMHILGSNYCHIYDNIVCNATLYGFYVWGSDHNIFEDNELLRNGNGMLLDNSESNIIQNNEFEDTDNDVIHLQNDSDGTYITNNLINNFGGDGIFGDETTNTIISNTNLDKGEEAITFKGLGTVHLSDSKISNTTIGINVTHELDLTVENCTISDSSIYDFSLGYISDGRDAQITALNTIFEEDKVYFYEDTCKLIVKWSLHVKVVDISGDPVPGANVRVLDNENGIFNELFTTGANGYVRWISTIHYIEDSSGKTYHTPHTVTAWNETASSAVPQEPFMDTSKEISITLYPDSDGDGVIDYEDEFPHDATQWTDSDGDGYGDNQSGNNADAFPSDPTQWVDSDGDGYGDNQTGNNPDEFPSDSTQWVDSDGDGYGDNQSGDNPDEFPSDPTQWLDSDGDSYGDNQSGNNPDAFPNDPNEWSDPDGDGIGDNTDAFDDDPTQWMDSDGDGYGDNQSGNNPDAFPDDPAASLDTDGDGYPNRWNTGKSESDSTTGLSLDAFPNDPDEWADSDGDGIGDNSDFLPHFRNEIFYLIIVFVVIFTVLIVILAFLKGSRKRRIEPLKKEAEEPLEGIEEEVLEGLICPECGQPLSEGEKICPSCGFRLEKEELEKEEKEKVEEELTQEERAELEGEREEEEAEEEAEEEEEEEAEEEERPEPEFEEKKVEEKAEISRPPPRPPASQEDKVIYKDGDRVRALRGVIVHEDDFLITLRRRDGEVKISKNLILKIESWKSKDDDQQG